MDQDAVLDTVRQFKNALESSGVRVEQMILYGSHTGGMAREDSDIDVVAVSPSFSGKSYWERIDLLTEAIYRVLAPIEASVFTPEEWKSEKSLMVDFARNGARVQ